MVDGVDTSLLPFPFSALWMASSHLLLLLLPALSSACYSTGVCGTGYCGAPASPCVQSSCQPGYTCGQYGCARNRARSALTQKVDGLIIGHHQPVTSKETLEEKEAPVAANNIFGMKRGSRERIKQEHVEGPPAIDNSSLLHLTNPNFVFRHCCEQRGLPDACLNKCHFNTYTKDALQAMYFKTDGCPLEAASDMQFCAAQGMDHTACCLRNGVATTLAGPKCLTFCDQRPDRVTKLDYSYVPCYDRFENMKRCFYNEVKHLAEKQFNRH